jgi:hypothetical protein
MRQKRLSTKSSTSCQGFSDGRPSSRFAAGKIDNFAKSPAWESLTGHGGRERFRTSDPYRVKVVLSP